MSFIPAARVADFENITRKSLAILGKRLLLMKNDDGTFRCIEIQCKHQGADLSQGKWEGTVVTCPRHGWKYDLATGECLNHESSPLREHEVRLEGDRILVSARPS